QCNSGTSCPGVYSPAFFTQKMLNTVTTQVWTGTGTSYRNVDVWTLSHVFKDPGDGHAKILWLDRISHAGTVGTTTTTPDVRFNAVQMNNRVDKTSTKDPIIRYRISSIVDEAGGVLSVNYSAPECVLGSNMPASPDTNTKRCYPVYWTPYGQSSPTFDWFHKYLVTGVTEADNVGGAPAVTTAYTYLDTPAWHYDEAEFVPPSHKSWGQWRGYSKVRVARGQSGQTRSQTDTLYFRGMDGDKTSTGTRSVSIVDSDGVAVTDAAWRPG